jgi:4-hydroxyacetophenone monooxygenase
VERDNGRVTIWTDDDLRHALDDASLPTLLMVLVHLTGDRTWIEDPYLPARNPLVYAEEDGGFSDEMQLRIREAEFGALTEWRDKGQSAFDKPARDLMIEMMNVCMGEEIPPEYAELMFEELGFVARDPKLSAPARAFRVLIIGAGMSGLLTAIKLKAAGVDFDIIEKNETVGGTWYENSYPGCGVDTPNHFYSFSFEPNHQWTGYYSKQQELHDYFEGLADRYDLRSAIRFQTMVDTMAWDSDARQWEVSVRDAAGAPETLRYDSVVTAVGQLNRPKFPVMVDGVEDDGTDAFAGPSFHSATWRHDVDLAGKRVGVVGTGASAMQFVPIIADQAETLTIFQRSPQWAVPNPNYHRTVGDGKKWLLEHVPFYAKWYRFRLFWKFGDGLIPSLQKDPEWELPKLSLNKINDSHRRFLTKHIDSQIGGDAELRAKVLPAYPPYGKRMLIDNNWFATMGRDDVDLVVEPIAQITGSGVDTTDGVSHDLDVIIYATGFESFKLLFPMEIRGKSGALLNQVWSEDDATAHVGMTVPDFPNLFLMYGPNTNLGHGGSAIFHAECQVRYLQECLKAMIDNDLVTMEVKSDVHDDYVARVDAAHEAMIWTHEGMNNWYRNKNGRVVSNSPWRLVDYWRMTHEVDLDEYICESTAGEAAPA